MDMKEPLLVLGSPVLVDDPKMYSVGKEVILETWFQENVPRLFRLDIEQVILVLRHLEDSL